jgi:heat shock protein HslJ
VLPATRHSHRGPRLLLLTIATVAVGLVLAGCGQTPNDTKSATAGLPDLEQSLSAHEWLLDPSDSTVASVDGHPVTLVFTTGTAASGSGPCNSYRAGVTLDGDRGVTFDHPATTLIGCDPPVAAAESAYLDALLQVNTADVTDRDRLILTGDGARLSFTASPQPSTSSAPG